ncbi:MAG: hypothetical protein ABIQ88_20790 [Chitinophagaceae bacterium]
MKQVTRFFGKNSIHSFLLPVFFTLHNYIQYYGLVSVGVALKTMAIIMLVLLFLFLLLFLFTRHVARCLQIITLISFVFLFYGIIKDFISKTAGLPFFASYSVLLPLMLLCTLVLCAVIWRKKDFFRINLFQNVLLLLFILADTGQMIFTQSQFFLSKNMLVKKDLLQAGNVSRPAERPDVYYLLFDCYPGTGFLRNFMQFDNSPMDSTLQGRGFRVINDSRSNYNRTVFSMASALNFEYLHNINNNTVITPQTYTQSRLSIKYGAVPELFDHLGYKLYNLSIFEIGHQPPLHREDFLTLPEQRVLLYNTLGERFKADVLWNFISGKYSIGLLRKVYVVQQSEVVAAEVEKRAFNDKVADSLQSIPRKRDSLPKFVYAHFYLPHPPFFYDEKGNSNDLNFVVTEKSLLDKHLFISYLQYTNKVMLRMIDSILVNAQRPPVIIVQSDHGFRDFEGGPSAPYLFFKNYIAFYFPDRDYHGLYDTLSNVNTFPIVFNKYFNTRIPMQKDTSTFLPY